MIEIPIPPWCKTIRIKASAVAKGEIDILAVGPVDGSPLLVYGKDGIEFMADAVAAEIK